MYKRASVAIIALFAFALPVSTAVGSSNSERAQPLVVTSTLDGKKALPHRIRWKAGTNIAASRVASVEFLIDGKVRWIERNPPYAYGYDLNWLVTTWLAPGRHSFTVRAKAKDGRTASQTTDARVAVAPSPPAQLMGTWTHHFGGPGLKWVLTVDKTGWSIRDPFGTGNLIDVVYLSEGRLQARSGIRTKVNGPFEGNGWCMDSNASVSYRWAISAKTLTLAHFGVDRCTEGGENESQHVVLDGDWTRGD